MTLHRLARIAIGVPEAVLAATRAFYRELGLEEREPGRFATRDGGEQLVIGVAARRSLQSLAIGVDDESDLARAGESLAALGVVAERGDGTLSAREGTTGVAVTLVVEPRRHSPRQARIATNGPGRSERTDARSPAAVPGAAPPRPVRLSHVVTTSSDPAQARRFFVEGLGLRVSDEIPALGAAFLRCSADHHNLLVQPGPFPFLHHTAWEMEDVDAVGAAAAAMIAADERRHAWGLGRHGIGSNYFWYLRDPAGNFAEYTSDLDVILDEAAWRSASAGPVAGLAAWGPPVPREFLAPDDILALARGEAR